MGQMGPEKQAVRSTVSSQQVSGHRLSQLQSFVLKESSLEPYTNSVLLSVTSFDAMLIVVLTY